MSQLFSRGKQVIWKAPKGQELEEWDDTEVTFDILTDDKQTYIRFRHSGWRENTDFYAHCSMKWATFMLSLKDLLEKGKGVQGQTPCTLITVEVVGKATP
jgi:hypothetical protein